MIYGTCAGYGERSSVAPSCNDSVHRWMIVFIEFIHLALEYLVGGNCRTHTSPRPDGLRAIALRATNPAPTLNSHAVSHLNYRSSVCAVWMHAREY